MDFEHAKIGETVPAPEPLTVTEKTETQITLENRKNGRRVHLYPAEFDAFVLKVMAGR